MEAANRATEEVTRSLQSDDYPVHEPLRSAFGPGEDRNTGGTETTVLTLTWLRSAFGPGQDRNSCGPYRNGSDRSTLRSAFGSGARIANWEVAWEGVRFVGDREAAESPLIVCRFREGDGLAAGTVC
jgi:hypothetical protein